MKEYEERELVRTHKAFVYKVALRASRTGGGELEDCVQDAYLEFVKACRTFDPKQGANIRTYATRMMQWGAIAKYTARERESRKQELVSLDAKVDDEDRYTLHDVVGTPATQEEELAREETWQALKKAMLGLSKLERECVLRSFYAGRSNDEIGRELGYSREWVRLQLKQALVKLREAMADFGP